MSLSVTSVKFEQSFSVVDKVLYRSSRSQKQVFSFQIFHYSQCYGHVCNTCVTVSYFNRVESFRTAFLLKKRLQHRIDCKFFKNRFLTEHFRWLLLLIFVCWGKTFSLIKYFHALALSLACKCKGRWTSKRSPKDHQCHQTILQMDEY